MSVARFGVHKPVPANLLMMAILLSGLVVGLSLRREFFPESDPYQATVSLIYPGAMPEEVEQAMAIKVEDKLADLDEVEELRTTLSEGGGGITVEFREGVDVDQALDEVERAVDALTDLPEESEKIQVQLFEPRLPVMRVTAYGDVHEQVMKRTIRAVRDDLQSLDGMGEVVVTGVRDYELRVDVRSGALLEHGISLPQVTDTIRDWMTDLPGGTVRSSTGNVKVRTLGVAERAEAIRQIVVKADATGAAVRVDDIAQVSDGFVDEDVINRYNGQPSASLVVFSVGQQDIVHIAEMVRAYVDGRNAKPFVPQGIKERLILSDWWSHPKEKPDNNPGTQSGGTAASRGGGVLERLAAWELGRSSPRPLPPGVTLENHSDFARFVEGRLDLLLRNARYGAVLVFATLLVFLNWRVAWWVGVGLLTALMGTLVLMAWLDVTLNLLTMFGLIVVLGLLVDDAIVVSENIQSRHDQGEPALQAAVSGAEQVLWPVGATVLTTVVAFLPLTFIRGHIGDLLGALPMVVACALLMSLVESLVILPSHMGHSLAKRDRSRPGRGAGLIRRFERWRDHLVLGRLVPAYGRLLGFLLRQKYVTLCVAVAVLMVSVAMVKGGWLGYTFMPRSDAETVIVDLRMPIGTPIDRTHDVVSLIEQASQSQDETKSVAAVVGQASNLDTGVVDAYAPHIAQMFIELKLVEQRDRESSQVVASIREALAGRINEVERISFTQITGGPGGKDISIQVRGHEPARLQAAVEQLKRMLATYRGVHDIADDNDLGQLELRIQPHPGAAGLGLTTNNVARQVRGFLYGLDAHVFAERQEDIDVRVRLDEQTRRSLVAIENCWLVGPTGDLVPMREVAQINETTTYATVKRIDRQRAVTVTADTAPGVSPEWIVSQLQLDELRGQFPDLRIEFAGRQQQQADAFASLPLGFLAAVVMIYVILAWLFSSYLQPLLVLVVVPFSTIGVIWGHLLLGYELTFLSLIGFVALTGIVVNDSLILVEFYNLQRRRGQTVYDSLVAAGRGRLRAILLTTITTVLGLTPLILERSFQAKFLIPMGISIAMGLISATALVLIMLPCMILVFEDGKSLAYFLWHGSARPQAAAETNQ